VFVTMHFAIKTHIQDASASQFEFRSAKTMYLGKHISAGDKVFLFASENEGGLGLLASGRVTRATAVPKPPGRIRQTPRVSITVERLLLARRPLGRAELKRFTDWSDGRPQTELNFKLYRQTTDKIVGVSDEAARFLDGYF
jgi:hypothetical protein